MYSADTVLDALLFPAPLQSNVDMLRSQFAQVGNIVNPAQREFMMQAQAAFEDHYSQEALRRDAQIVKEHRGIGQAYQTMILELLEVDELQMASPLMQNYIMACPEVHALYKKQHIEGFYETYVPAEPEAELWQNVYYQRACHAVAVDEGEGKLQHFYSEDDLELTFDEQIRIQHTWDALRVHLQGERDPTSVSNQDL